jgi:phosphatidate cytidylyltransferase
MLKTRLIVIIVMVPILVLFAALGGLPYAAMITLMCALAAWEFWRMFQRGGYAPSAVLTIGGAVLFCVQAYFDVIPLQAVLVLLILISALVQLLKYERDGQDNAALGFCVTLAGSLYWGFLGAYLIHLRMLPDGLWWLLLVLPAVWASDAGAYLVGSRFGKHFMSKRISPRKTWEGYFGGIAVALLVSAALGALWHQKAEAVTWLNGLLLGGMISIIVPLGDFTASMFKRFFSLKDSSRLIPGHGGVIDRIDTWVWAAVLGYYFAVFLR